jgi:peptidoglycan/LPS O-acetylase OafA/YrhL
MIASLWSRARDTAEKAPPERNRYVDFLRALSILAVVVGHWLVALPFIGAAFAGFGPGKEILRAS